MKSELAEDLDSLSEDAQAVELGKTRDVLKNFAEKWQAYAADANGFLREDLQQVFILFVLQAYRQKNLKQMITTIKVGGVLSVVLLVVTGLSGFLVGI